MTIVAFPLDAVSGAPAYTGETLRQVHSALVAGRTDRPLGGVTGVSPGTPTGTVTADSSTWTIGTHSGVLDLETPAAAGPYLYAVAAADTGAMSAASSSNDRIDLLSLVVDDPAEGDGTSVPRVRAALTVGTPAGSPSPPAGPARSMPLAQIRVPKTGTGSPVVTWVAPYTAAAGGIIPCASSSAYPANPYAGMVIYDMTLDRVLRYTGGAWKPVGAVSGLASGITTDGNGYFTVTHGLGFTPSAVHVTVATDGPTTAAGVLSITAIGATTFKVRFWRFAAASASHWVVDTADSQTFSFRWTAHP